MPAPTDRPVLNSGSREPPPNPAPGGQHLPTGHHRGAENTRGQPPTHRAEGRDRPNSLHSPGRPARQFMALLRSGRRRGSQRAKIPRRSTRSPPTIRATPSSSPAALRAGSGWRLSPPICSELSAGLSGSTLDCRGQRWIGGVSAALRSAADPDRRPAEVRVCRTAPETVGLASDAELLPA